MKIDVREMASLTIDNLLKASLPSATLIRRNKKNGFALDTGVKDENGTPIYAIVSFSIGATEDTKTTKAFNLEECIKEYTEWLNAPKKEKKKSEKTTSPEEQEKRDRRNAQKKELYAWIDNNLGETPMNTTEIQLACPAVETVPLMMVGTWMTAYAKDNPAIVRDTIKGKTFYRKA